MLSPSKVHKKTRGTRLLENTVRVSRDDVTSQKASLQVFSSVSFLTAENLVVGRFWVSGRTAFEAHDQRPEDQRIDRQALSSRLTLPKP